jgi:hypothetical protein
MSKTNAETRPPCPTPLSLLALSHSAFTCARTDSRRAVMTKFAPARAKRIAVAAPMPFSSHPSIISNTKIVSPLVSRVHPIAYVKGAGLRMIWTHPGCSRDQDRRVLQTFGAENAHGQSTGMVLRKMLFLCSAELTAYMMSSTRAGGPRKGPSPMAHVIKSKSRSITSLYG